MKTACIVIFMIGARAFAQVGDSNLKVRIDSMIVTQMQKEKAVGLAIAIVKDGKIWYNRGYGVKELNTNKPVDSLTNFHLASISKVFVATAIMQLVEQGKINLDAKLTDYIPVNHMRDERFKAVTIGQMLIHRSGIPDVENCNWDKPKNDSLALRNYAKKCIETEKLLFDPGTKFQYSSMAFEILGSVIENISKRTFDAYEYDHVLNIAGLSNSSFDYTKIDPSRRSSPHVMEKIKVSVSDTYPFNREHSPSSTLNSCTYDMCQWMLELLRIYHDTTNSYKGVVKHETLMNMWRLKESEFMGLTWFLKGSPLGLCAAHGGGDHGYSSVLAIFPEQDVGMIILINGHYPEGLTEMADYIPFLVKNKIKKQTIEYLKLLEGKYVVTNPPSKSKRKWKIMFKEEKGELVGKDHGHRYALIPLGNGEFFSTDEGTSIVFDTKDKDSISLAYFSNFKFKRVK